MKKPRGSIIPDWKEAHSFNILDRALLAFALSYVLHRFKFLSNTFEVLYFGSIHTRTTPILKQSVGRRSVSKLRCMLGSKKVYNTAIGICESAVDTIEYMGNSNQCQCGMRRIARDNELGKWTTVLCKRRTVLRDTGKVTGVHQE